MAATKTVSGLDAIKRKQFLQKRDISRSHEVKETARSLLFFVLPAILETSDQTMNVHVRRDLYGRSSSFFPYAERIFVR